MRSKYAKNAIKVAIAALMGPFHVSGPMNQKGVTLAYTTAEAAIYPSLGPGRRLRKISRKIRGKDPSKQEYQMLQEVLKESDSAKLEDFYRERVREYLKDPNHIIKMTYRVLSLLNISPSFDTYKDGILQTAPGKYLEDTATASLIRNLIGNNLSWDYLLTARSFEVYGYNERNFYNNIPGSSEISQDEWKGKLSLLTDPEKRDNFKYYQFDDESAQIAGVLSTLSWRKRFNVDNEINKNRRNAAAVFRVFLCDPMVPGVESNRDKDLEALHFMLNANYVDTEVNQGRMVKDKTEFTEEEITAAAQDKHGTDASCMGCHSKLDPAGKAFGENELYEMPKTSHGGEKLVFNYGAGNAVDEEVDGLRGLANRIIETDRYAACQVEHFWNWFVANETKNLPSPQEVSAIKEKFNEMDRKVNDFIEYIVMRPEFSYDYSNPDEIKEEDIQITHETISPTLARCNSCHGYLYESGSVPFDITAPFTGSDEDITRLEAMRYRLSLPEDDPNSMPLGGRSDWEQSDLDNILKWINNTIGEEKK